MERQFIHTLFSYILVHRLLQVRYFFGHTYSTQSPGGLELIGEVICPWLSSLSASWVLELIAVAAKKGACRGELELC